MNAADIDGTFYGDPGLRARWEATECKGNLIASRRRYLDEHGGEQAVRAVIAALDDQAAELVDNPPPASVWCGFDQLARIDRVIVDVVMRGDVTQMLPFGREIAAYDLNSLYRGLMRVAGERWVLRGLPLVWGLYLRPGKPVVTELEREARTCRIHIADACMPRYMCALGIRGWIESSLDVAGSPGALVDHDACMHDGATACAYRIGW